MDQERADEIVTWAIDVGRNPTDTAGMDSDDEEWLSEHPEYEDYIDYQYASHYEDKKRRETERHLNELQKAQQRLALSKGSKIIPDNDMLIEIAKTISEKHYNPEITRRMREEEKRVAKKTMKKKPMPKHKYPYPDEFIKKDGTLKASNKKKRLQWLKEYKASKLLVALEPEPELEPGPYSENDEIEEMMRQFIRDL